MKKTKKYLPKHDPESYKTLEEIFKEITPISLQLKNLISELRGVISNSGLNLNIERLFNNQTELTIDEILQKVIGIKDEIEKLKNEEKTFAEKEKERKEKRERDNKLTKG